MIKTMLALLLIAGIVMAAHVAPARTEMAAGKS
jgi:hypothetical protein